jgi:integrase/recombinase XerD
LKQGASNHDNTQRKQCTNQAPVLYLFARGEAPERGYCRRGSKRPSPIRDRHKAQRLQGVSLPASDCIKEAPSRANQHKDWKQVKQGHHVRDLAHAKRFFQWLSQVPGYKSTVQYPDAEYFNMSDNDTRIATAKREQAGPTLGQVRHAISKMPAQNEIERRNRALVAFTILTGARDSAIASMKLKHVDLIGGSVHQDARDVRTKFRKTFTTYFFSVGDDIRQIVADWMTYLCNEKLWGHDAPFFPSTQMGIGETRQFEVVGVKPEYWSNATPIRTIFRDCFESAGLPYFNPHSFRNTLVRLGEETCQTPEHFKAWSQNLGHEGVLTTFLSYGAVTRLALGYIMHSLATPKPVMQTDINEIVAMFREMRDIGAKIIVA